MKLVGKLVSRTAHAGSVGASALNHEIRNHAMENQTVVKRSLFFPSCFFVREFLGSFRQPDEILNSFRSFLVEQLDHNISERSFKNGVRACGTSHVFSSKV